MAVNISAWSIRHPVPPIVLALAIVALGYINFIRMPITRMPNVDIPVITVVTTQFGAAPAELEAQVTKKDRGCRRRRGRRSSRQLFDRPQHGQHVITFRFGIDTDRALNDVKDAVTRIRAIFRAASTSR